MQKAEIVKKLNAYRESLNTTDPELFHIKIIHLWNYVHETKDTAKLVTLFENKYDYIKKQVPTKDLHGKMSDDLPSYRNEIEHIAMCYFIVRDSVNSNDNGIELKLGVIFFKDKYNPLKKFKESFVDPILNYIEEHFSSSNEPKNVMAQKGVWPNRIFIVFIMFLIFGSIVFTLNWLGILAAIVIASTVVFVFFALMAVILFKEKRLSEKGFLGISYRILDRTKYFIKTIISVFHKRNSK